MTMHHVGLAQESLGDLTTRQRDVLDRLLLHKTSKEIARDLGISPHTVEQRIRGAKEKLGVLRRSDLATAYRQLRSICGELVYDESRIDMDAYFLSLNGQPSETAQLVEHDPLANAHTDMSAPVPQHHLAPAIFEGPTGTLMRIGAVVAITFATIIVGIGGMAVLEQLSRIVS